MVQRQVASFVPPRALRAGAAVVAAVLSGSLAACSNGVEAGTLDETAWNGASTDLGDLRIRNAVLVSGEDGMLSVSLTVVNTGTAEDALLDVELTGDGDPVTADLSPTSIALPPGTATVVPGGTEATIEAEVDAPAGNYVPVTMQFENAGSVDLPLLVVTDGSPQAGHGDAG